MFLLYLQRNDEEYDFMLDVRQYLEMGDTDFLMISNKDTKLALNEFMKQTGKERYSRIYYKIQKANINMLKFENKLEDWIREHFSELEEEIEELKTSHLIKYERLRHSSLTISLKAERHREYIYEKLREIKVEWQKTMSYWYLYEELLQNEIYNERMEKLKLIWFLI